MKAFLVVLSEDSLSLPSKYHALQVLFLKEETHSIFQCLESLLPLQKRALSVSAIAH